MNLAQNIRATCNGDRHELKIRVVKMLQSCSKHKYCVWHPRTIRTAPTHCTHHQPPHPMTSRSTEPHRPHLLVFPYPDQGHMIPLLDLAHLLAARGFFLTIVVTPSAAPLLDPLLSRNLPIEPLVLAYDPNRAPDLRRHPSVPRSRNLMQALCTLSDPISDWFRTHPSPPICIISDFFLGWTYHLARQLGIERIAFFPSGAFTVSVFHSLWINLPQRPSGHEDDDEYPVRLPDVPGCPTLPWYHLLANYRRYRRSDPQSEFIRDSFLGNISSWGSVFNTFHALEGRYLDHLKGTGRVWAAGPIVPLPENVVDRGGKSSVPITRIQEWLDSKMDRSVVYVCFGSQAVLSDWELDELGAGLQAACVDFLWCFKDSQALPRLIELEQQVGERGLIINGWVPQVMILKHRAVGGFLTHCGWNSTMEGLTAGVPLLACPRGADQFLTTRLLVDELGVAVRVGSGELQRDTVARAVVKVVQGDAQERVRASEVQRWALGAVQEGGSSFNDLNMLVNELYALDSATRRARLAAPGTKRD